DEHVRTPRELSLDGDGREPESTSYIGMARAVGRDASWNDLHWTGDLAAYLDLVRADPRLARNAYQRLFDAVVSFGVERAPPGSGRPVHYRFFDDPFDGGRDAVFGIEHCLSDLVAHLRAAAHGLGPERRVLLLH